MLFDHVMRRNTKGIIACIALLLLCPRVELIMAQTRYQIENIVDTTARAQIDSGNLFFPQSVGNDKLQAIVYQEVVFQTNGNGTIYLSAAINQRGVWERYDRFSVPVQFSRDTPPLLFSALVTDNGELIVALLSDPRAISIYRYMAADPNPRVVAQITTEVTTVAPRLFQRPDGGVICFMSSRESDSERQSIYFAISDDATAWSSLRVLARLSGNHASFLPAYAAIDDREVVVFQSLIPNQASVYQLYFTYSDIGGARWATPSLITNFRLPSEQESQNAYDNQQPTIVTNRDRILLAWERRTIGEPRRIVYAELNHQGNLITDPLVVTADSDFASRPQLLLYRDRALISWSGGQGQDRFVAISTQSQNNAWVSQRIGRNRTEKFSSLAMNNESAARISWIEVQNSRSGRVYTENISFPTPDIKFRGGNFQIGQPSRNSVAVIAWRRGNPNQQVSGFRYAWSFSEATAPTGEASLSATQDSVQVIASREGDWYFTLQAQDLFGNWLEVLILKYQHDTSPPATVRISQQPETDADGFAISNTFDIEWSTGNESDIAGYYINFRRIGNANQTSEQIDDTPPNTLSLNYRNDNLQHINLDNGLWRLRVAAIDRAGNNGPLTEQDYRLNKYVPVTFIYGVASSVGDTRPATLTINGSGFLEDGQVEECVLDADGNAPYDYQFTTVSGDCQVISNSTIGDIPLSRIRSGSYYVGVDHSQRGITFSNSSFELLSSGTVLFGQFESPYTPQISTAGMLPNNARYQSRIVFAFIIAILALLIIFLLARLLNTIRESMLWKKELERLDYASDSQYTKKTLVTEVKNLQSKGVSLRIKFTIFITLLIITIVLLISVVLGSSSLRRQERVLATSLQDRVSVLLDSISTQAGGVFINSDNPILGLEPLVNQLSVLDEAQYITITAATRDSTEYGAVWATNDARILNFDSATSIDGDELSLTTERLIAGQSVIEDAISTSVLAGIDEVNRRTSELVGDLPQRIIGTNQQVVRLVTESARNNTALDSQRLESFDEQLAKFTIELSSALRERQLTVQSIPQYDTQRLDKSETAYIFHQPIVAWNADRIGTSGLFYQGTVRIGISTELLLEQLSSAQSEIILATLIIAAIATGIGIFGASLLAAIVVAPIRRIVRGVEVISATDDKSDLRNHTIAVNSRDELAVLAQSVNQMTRGLVRASDANKELTVGKEVQKLFIPLTKDQLGNKLSIADNDYAGIEIGGYYEGAHGVSGDYFSYAKLDDDNLVLIKCDVSGKGVPAALIMVEVATIFSDFTYQNDAYKKPNALAMLATRINDLLESVQFKGRFAALTMAIINQRSGKVRITNAGDKQVHIYRHTKQLVEVINLTETPAAGVFPSSMLPNGFVEQITTLAPNDALIFFTDGVDESRRTIRNSDFSPRYIMDGERREEEAEDFSIERIHDIVTAVMNNNSYQLQRKHDLYDGEMRFDYHSLPISAISLVKAIIAAEHVFRLCPLNDGGTVHHAQDERTTVHIDKEIVAFLSATFINFEAFFNDEAPHTEEEQYRQYRGLYEEGQYDDLTLVVVRKK